MLYLDLNKAAYKLHYKMEFQDLPISIENRKGSKRHWYDPHNKTEGTTTMEFPYGYIRGTLGTDGDHVDVYVGPDKQADKVFVITQMKAPEFKAVDEQKCMLGFPSGKEAKAAYIRHYNNPKFFGSMKAVSMEEFKSKLKKKGKLIKHVKAGIIPDGDGMKKSQFRSVNAEVFQKSLDEDSEDLGTFKAIQDRIVKKSKATSEAQRKPTQSAAHPTKAVEEFQSTTPKGSTLPEIKKSDEDVEKALKASSVSSWAKRARIEDAYKAKVAQPQPEVGTNRSQDLLVAPVVPVRRVQPPEAVYKGEAFESCVSCGHMSKADTACIHCAERNKPMESVPYWRR